MPKISPEDYLPVESYVEAFGVFHAVSTMILFEFAREERTMRDLIVRNFLARTDMMVGAVLRLWEIQDYQDCWILTRCLLDRLFLLSHLQAHNEFELFDDWSFYEQYKLNNRVRSDPEFGVRAQTGSFDFTPEQKERMKRFEKDPPVWRRPKAEKEAERLDMRFLYRYGYDFGSTHVHAMANDGHQDFYTITKLEPVPAFPDQRSVLSNSLLFGTMMVQQGLNASTLSWRALIYNFLDDLRRLLDSGQKDYRRNFVKLGILFKDDVRLCGHETNRSTTDESASDYGDAGEES